MAFKETFMGLGFCDNLVVQGRVEKNAPELVRKISTVCLCLFLFLLIIASVE